MGSKMNGARKKLCSLPSLPHFSSRTAKKYSKVAVAIAVYIIAAVRTGNPVFAKTSTIKGENTLDAVKTAPPKLIRS